VTDPTPYIHLRGTARQALSFYADVFGGTAQLHTFGEFNRSDGPADYVAHGYLMGATSRCSPRMWLVSSRPSRPRG
jgi:PhnB protein